MEDLIVLRDNCALSVKSIKHIIILYSNPIIYNILLPIRNWFNLTIKTSFVSMIKAFYLICQHHIRNVFLHRSDTPALSIQSG